jgi:hypothetical protein
MYGLLSRIFIFKHKGGIMGIVGEVANVAAGAARRVLPQSFLDQLHAVATGENIQVDQELLGDHIGHVALVGDFGYGTNQEIQTSTAARVARVLEHSGMAGRDSTVKIHILMPVIPEVPDTQRDDCLDRSVDLLAHELKKVSKADQHVAEEPVRVPTHDQARLVPRAYAEICGVIPERTTEVPDTSVVFVGNREFLAHVFDHLPAYSMANGGVAVLDEVGNNPRANRFVQLPPAVLTAVPQDA